MKKSEFKKVVKQVMIECFQDEDVQMALKESMRNSTQEVILQSGLLSSVISEVVSGLSPMLTETQRSQPQQTFFIEDDEPQFTQVRTNHGAATRAAASEFEEAFAVPVERQNNNIYEEMRARQAASRPQLNVGGVNVFEGTRATTSGGASDQFSQVTTHAAASEQQGVIPDEARDFLTKTFSDRWKSHMSRKFERNIIPGVIANRKQGTNDSRGLFQNENQVKKASEAIQKRDPWQAAKKG